MYILEVTCSDAVLQNVFYVVRKVLFIIQIAVPILLIVAATLSFFTLMTNPDDKKAPGKIKNSVIAAVIVFFIPLLVNFAMSLVGENTNISDCWNKATSKVDTTTGGQYQDPNGYGNSKQANKSKGSSEVVYEKGNQNTNNNSNNNSNNN